MRRRDFIKGIGSTVAWPLAARAQQQADKLPTIGFLGGDATIWSPWTAAFSQRLRELGWIEDRTITIDYRWSEGSADRIAEIAAEFVRLNVNVIVGPGTAVPTLKQATAVIPIVFTLAIDPVGSGLVASLARPGGNLTGSSAQGTDLAGKRVALLRELVPRLHRLATMADVRSPDPVLEMRDIQATAGALGLDIVTLEIRSAEDIAAAFEGLNGKADALYVVGDAFMHANRSRIVKSALSARLPTTFNTSDYVQAGGLMSYGPNFPEVFRRSADFVDKILRGTKPGDIPVEQATKLELSINLTTAKALGLTVPQTLLATADEVIE